MSVISLTAIRLIPDFPHHQPHQSFVKNLVCRNKKLQMSVKFIMAIRILYMYGWIAFQPFLTIHIPLLPSLLILWLLLTHFCLMRFPPNVRNLTHSSQAYPWFPTTNRARLIFIKIFSEKLVGGLGTEIKIVDVLQIYNCNNMRWLWLQKLFFQFGSRQ